MGLNLEKKADGECCLMRVADFSMPHFEGVEFSLKSLEAKYFSKSIFFSI